MPKDSDTQPDPQTMVVKSKLEWLLRTRCHSNSGENSAATRHMIVHDESGQKLFPMEELPQERSTEADSQRESFDQVCKIADNYN